MREGGLLAWDRSILSLTLGSRKFKEIEKGRLFEGNLLIVSLSFKVCQKCPNFSEETYFCADFLKILLECENP